MPEGWKNGRKRREGIAWEEGASTCGKTTQKENRKRERARWGTHAAFDHERMSHGEKSWEKKEAEREKESDKKNFLKKEAEETKKKS